MKLDVSEEIIFGACASGIKEAMIESGLLTDFGEALKTLERVRLLKEGLLTGEQAAAMLQISLKTFKRQVAKKMWPEIRIMGSQEYRYPLADMLHLINLRKNRQSAVEEEQADAA